MSSHKMTLPNGDVIHEGEYGVNRKGEKVGPMVFNYSGPPKFIWKAGHLTFAKDGGYDILEITERDIIAKWVDGKERKFTHPDDAPEGHEWETLRGDQVRIYATDGAPNYPIHGAVRDSDGWGFLTWSNDGSCIDVGVWDECNLIDKPRKHVRWVNLFQDGKGNAYDTRAAADSHKQLLVGNLGGMGKTISRIACIRIEFEEGEGL